MKKWDFSDVPMIEDTFTETEIEEIMQILNAMRDARNDSNWKTIAVVATNHKYTLQ
jgi:predicted transcriptional regulator